VLDGITYGSYDFPEIGINPENAFLGVDFIKLLYFIKMNNQNSQFFIENVDKNIDKILNKFFDDPKLIDKYILSKNYYVVPNLKYFENFNNQSFMDYLINDLFKQYNLIENDIDKNKVLSCDQRDCYDIESLMINLYNRNKIFYLYDLETLEKLDKNEIKETEILDYLGYLINDIELNIIQNIRKYLDDSDNEFDEFNSSLKRINFLTLEAVDIKTYLGEIMNTITSLENILKKLNTNKYTNLIRERINKLNEQYDIILDVYKKIRNFIQRDLITRNEFVEQGFFKVEDYELLQPKIMKKEIDKIIFEILKEN
jgi:hypothetical protein